MNGSTEEQCLMCGISRGFSVFPECRQEARMWGIELVNITMPNSGQHVWVEKKEATRQ